MGHPRYFTLENDIIATLFECASNLPKEWRDIEDRVVRRDRVQTVSGSVQSALYGCAFGLQERIKRQAGNHKIQSTGAQITKEVQVAVWSKQPIGVHEYVVLPMNVHDELNATHTESVKNLVLDAVERLRSVVPLLSLTWKEGVASWGHKDANDMKIAEAFEQFYFQEAV
jgi:hypothetical protein